jgi:DNA mismatch endonuclease (patch repair protein)
MPDKFPTQTRSKMMSKIKSKNTKPEILVRKKLFADGFRYRVNNIKLPGKPDIVLEKYKAVIFVNGCFWHGHTCRYFVWPKSNQEFWGKKITRNRQNDEAVQKKLLELGYRVCIIWECVTRDKSQFLNSMEAIKVWLDSNDSVLELSI